MAQTQLITRATHGDSLADILERVLNTGVVIAGDIRIKLCDVELLTIQIRLLICSVDKAKELGIRWWWQTPEQNAPSIAPGGGTPQKISAEPAPASASSSQEFWRADPSQQVPDAAKVMKEGISHGAPSPSHWCSEK